MAMAGMPTAAVNGKGRHKGQRITSFPLFLTHFRQKGAHLSLFTAEALLIAGGAQQTAEVFRQTV